MKLFEVIVDDRADDKAVSKFFSAMANRGHCPVRVEIHSLNDPPWPTERPLSWGKGCWFEAKVWQHGGATKRTMILLSSAPFDDNKFHYRGFDPVLGCETSVTEESITAYGPRAEVPR